jgi:hypothetical protein
MKLFIQTLFFFLLVTQLCFAQWGLLGLEDKSIKDIAARNPNIFAITVDSALYRSTDYGITWLQIVDSSAVDIAIAPTGDLFMVKKFPRQLLYDFKDSLYRSSDNGNTWVNLNIMEQLPTLSGYRPTNVTISPLGILYCGISFNNRYSRIVTLALSTNDGSTWTSPGEQVPGGDIFDFIGEKVITSGYEYAISSGCCYVNLSTDNGQTWTCLGSSGFEYNTVLGMYLNGNIIMGGTYSPPIPGFVPGLIISSDSCNTWTQVSSLIPETGISIESEGMLVGNDSLGVFLFSDIGDSLGSFNEGLSNLNTHTLSMDNNGYVYIGTDNGVWRRPLSEMITDVKEVEQLPNKFALEQNYPNPFNPSTTFRYSIPNQSKVIIKVYDILGKEIETLVNEEKPAGTYDLKWNAANPPSGVYFYQIRAGLFIETKKMILLK